MTVVPAVAGPVHAYRTVVYTWGEGVSWDAPIVARVGTVATARVCGCVRPPTPHRARLVRKRLAEETWHDESSLCRLDRFVAPLAAAVEYELSRGFKFPQKRIGGIRIASRGRRAPLRAGRNFGA